MDPQTNKIVTANNKKPTATLESKTSAEKHKCATKRKSEEVKSSQPSKKSLRKKGLCVNGRVEVNYYIYIEQENMKKKIQTR